MSRRRSRPKSRRPTVAVWAPLVAVAVTALVAGAVGLRRRRPATAPGSGGNYAPEPLTGDPSSVAAEDVAPV
jgi:hypothetical protein